MQVIDPAELLTKELSKKKPISAAPATS